MVSYISFKRWLPALRKRKRRMLHNIIFCAAVFFLCTCNSLGAYNKKSLDWPRLNVRALGMGGAFCALADDESAIFHNPAGLGKLKRLRFGTSHSVQHFPGEIKNLDQLDCDPAVIVYPTRLGTYAAGFTLQGELGYDYLKRNSPRFPRERLWGWERFDGYGVEVTPWTYFGFAHRTNEYDFNNGKAKATDTTWRQRGEGGSVGVIQTIIPGVDVGYVNHRLDYDYDDGRWGRTKRSVTGLKLRPTAWLDLCWQRERVLYKWVEDEYVEVTGPVYLSSGGEIRFGNWFRYRWGNMQGHRTWGYSWKILWFESHRAYVEGMMPLMIDGYPDEFTDYACKGFTVEL